MATINLGAIKFNWKGAYNNSTAYAVDDVVSSGGSSYVCILASTGNAVSNGTYWNIMSSAGTNGTNGSNGTDVGTVITTQGDLLYRDGSGLQRLAKGTASQELRMNSGATAPEWHTPAVASADFVKIASINQTTSAANAVQFNSCFTSAYDFYEIRGRLVAGGTYPRFQALNTANAVLNAASYKYSWGGSQINSSGTGNTQSGGTFGDSNINMNTWDTENPDKTKDFIIRVANPQTRVNLERPMIQWEAYGHSAGNELQHIQGVGYYNTSDKWGGFKIYSSSGSVNPTWYVNVYGLKS